MLENTDYSRCSRRFVGLVTCCGQSGSGRGRDGDNRGGWSERGNRCREICSRDCWDRQETNTDTGWKGGKQTMARKCTALPRHRSWAGETSLLNANTADGDAAERRRRTINWHLSSNVAEAKQNLQILSCVLLCTNREFDESLRA